MSISRLLVVDDDLEMQQMMVQYLQRNGFSALGAASRAEIDRRLAAGRFDLILLDVMLGDESGLEICMELRATEEIPIIIVSALSADHQRMAGYAAGADDYVAKPFNPDLLVARVRAVLRRARRAPSLGYRRLSGSWQFEGWRLEGRSGAVTAPDGVQVALSRREAGLLKVLLANPQVPLTREEIAEAMEAGGDGAGPEADGSGRAIDVLVGRLRGKIERNPREPQILLTARGVGYVLAAAVRHTPE